LFLCVPLAYGEAPPAASVPVAIRAGQVMEQLLARWDHDEHPDLKAVVVRRGGTVIGERYYNGEAEETLHDIRSAGKSVTALLMGAAVDRGRIRSVADPLSRYLPDAKGTPLGAVTLENLLTMRSGLDANDEEPSAPGNEDRLDESRDPVGFALGVPMRGEPGTRYLYNSLTAYLAGLVVEKAAGRRMDGFADEVLFRPLGIGAWRWQQDVAGHTKGQGNLFLTARDLAKIGQMVLNRGAYQGRRVISEQWIAEMLRPRVAIAASDPYADDYGYFWYSRTHQIGAQSVLVFFASGNGGNKIYVVPSLDLVVAIQSSAYGRSYGQRRSEAILKAILAAVPR